MERIFLDGYVQRTEGTIIGIDYDFGKTIKYKRSDRSKVFNDYEKSIIYPDRILLFTQKNLVLVH